MRAGAAFVGVVFFLAFVSGAFFFDCTVDGGFAFAAVAFDLFLVFVSGAFFFDGGFAFAAFAFGFGGDDAVVSRSFPLSVSPPASMAFERVRAPCA